MPSVATSMTRSRRRSGPGRASEGPLVGGRVAELEPDDLRADARLQLLRCAAGDDPAVVEQGDRVGQLVGLLQVLGGEQDGHAFVDQVADGAPELLAAARVQPGRRLVQEEQRAAARSC